MSTRVDEAARIRRVRQVLAVDGIGCATAATVLLTSDRTSRAVLPNARQRPVIATALGATSIALVRAAAAEPSRWSLRAAALVNLGWVTACFKALAAHRPSLYGSVLLAGTATFDALAGAAQWKLKNHIPR